MEEIQKQKFPKHKDHLNKTFLEELGHKLWSTKGIRFKASQRLLKRDNLSNKAIGFLSSYLIILGLFSVYNIFGEFSVNENVIAFSITTISILMLAFTQMEFAENFKLRAMNYQECALKISALYDELRIYKTLKKHSKALDEEFCREISLKYQDILTHYPNHEDLDYNIFRVEHSDYYDISQFKKRIVAVNYYIKVKLLYYILIYAPPILIISFLIIT